MKKLVKLLPMTIIHWYEDYILKDYERTKRFLTGSDPEVLQIISERKALKAFKRAARKVPAYKKFLKQHKLKARKVKNTELFEIIPETDKKNYVKKYSYEERCINGKFPKAGNIDESSGSTGTPTNWIRNKKEEEMLIKEIQFGIRYVINPKDEELMVLSCWSSGPWATGVKFCEIVEEFAMVKNIGTDIDKAISTLKMFGNKYHYVIAGYPQFIKEMVEKNFNWKEYHIDIITGGDGTAYGWHDYIRSYLRKDSKIISAYGSSDIDIGVGFETEYSQWIRKQCAEIPELNNDIFKKKQIPMLFQYNPTMYYVKNKGKEFTITALNPKIASPKIKYNLHDEGGQVSYKRMKLLLEKYGLEYKKETLKMPFLFVIGRSDGTISLDGANVYPQQVQRAIYTDEELTTKTNRYALEKRTDKKHNIQFFIHIELKKRAKKTARLKNKYARIIHRELLKENADYKESYTNNKRLKPRIKLYRINEGPFEEKRIKNKLIL